MNDDSLGIIASFMPLYSFERRDDDTSMVIIRLVSAVSLVYFVHQLSQEPQNIDDLYNLAGSGMTDLFEWGNQRLVYGQLGGSGMEDGRPRKKTAQEIFMESLMGEDEEEQKESEQGDNVESVEELEREEEDESDEIIDDDNAEQVKKGSINEKEDLNKQKQAEEAEQA